METKWFRAREFFSWCRRRGYRVFDASALKNKGKSMVCRCTGGNRMGTAYRYDDDFITFYWNDDY